MVDLVAKILRCHESLREAQIPHAFGGALALAWCTLQARGTIDIDINLLVGAERIEATLAGLPEGVVWDASDLAQLRKDLQHRLWWDETPVDLFFNSTSYHEELGNRVRYEEFAGQSLPFLSCLDLAVFKACFDRTKDWADLEAMQEAGTLNVPEVVAVIATLLGPDDIRVPKLWALQRP